MESFNPCLSFLAYDNRSGSTWLSSLLDENPKLAVTAESELLFHILIGPDYYENKSQILKLLESLYIERQFTNWKIARDILEKTLTDSLPLSAEDLFRKILHEYFKKNKQNAEIWVYKGCPPEWVEQTKRRFHKAKFIFIYRDGRAVFASKKKTNSLKFDELMDKDPIRSAKKWVKCFNQVDELNEKELFSIQYENLVKNTDKELNKLLKFLIGCEKSDIDRKIESNYQSKIPIAEKQIHSNLNKGPLSSRIDAWKNDLSFEEVFLYEKIAHSCLTKCRYQTQLFGKPLSKTHKFKIYILRVTLIVERLIKFMKRMLFYIRFPKKALWKMKILSRTKF